MGEVKQKWIELEEIARKSTIFLGNSLDGVLKNKFDEGDITFTALMLVQIDGHLKEIINLLSGGKPPAPADDDQPNLFDEGIGRT